MILFLDIGNTRIKWGCHDGAVWRDRGAMPVGQPEALTDVLAACRPTRAVIACVAGPQVRARIEALLANVPGHWLDAAETGHGLSNGYDHPGTLGVDRYAAMLACLRGGLAPCVVASAGTALTVDALAGDGTFLGGMIVPGARLMRESLGRGTAAVSVVAGEMRAFPRCTEDAVATGILSAMAGAVESMRHRLAGQLGVGDVRVVVTGGDAGPLAGLLADPVVIERDLVLEGLLWLARDLDWAGG